MDTDDLLGGAADGIEDLLRLPSWDAVRSLSPPRAPSSRGRSASVPATPEGPAAAAPPTPDRLRVLTSQVDPEQVSYLYNNLSSLSPGTPAAVQPIYHADGSLVRSRNVSPSPPRDAVIHYTHLDLSPDKPQVRGGALPPQHHQRIDHVDEGDDALGRIVAGLESRLEGERVAAQDAGKYVAVVQEEVLSLRGALAEKARALDFCENELRVALAQQCRLEETLGRAAEEGRRCEDQARHIAELEQTVASLHAGRAAEHGAAAELREESGRLRAELESARRLLGRHAEVSEREERLRDVERDFMQKVGVHEELLAAASDQEQVHQRIVEQNGETQRRLAEALADNSQLRDELLELRSQRDENTFLKHTTLQHETTRLLLEERYHRECANSLRLAEVSDIRLAEARGRAAMYAALFEAASSEARQHREALRDADSRTHSTALSQLQLEGANCQLEADLLDANEALRRTAGLVQGEAGGMRDEIDSLRSRLGAAQAGLADKEAELTQARRTILQLQQRQGLQTDDPGPASPKPRRPVSRKGTAITSAHPSRFKPQSAALHANLRPTFCVEGPWVPPPCRTSPPRVSRSQSRSASPRRVAVGQAVAPVQPVPLQVLLASPPRTVVPPEDEGHTPGRATVIQRPSFPPPAL